jgi:EmrB/QacA subfamily drug resistance transporter
MSTAETRPPFAPTPAKRAAVTVGIALVVFMAALEATVVGTAMPTVARAIGGLERYGWVFSSYLVASTAAIPVWGRAGDVYGLRCVYAASVAIFALGSIACGTARSIDSLIAFRAVQGLGAGGVIPIGLAVVGAVFTPTERARAQSLFSAVWGGAALVGPVLGGWLAESASWRLVFWVGVPFGISGALVVLATLGHRRDHSPKKPFDVLGSMLLVASSVAMLWALDLAPRLRVARLWPWFATAFFAAGASALVFAWVERRARGPIVPWGPFQKRLIGVGCGAVTLVGAAVFGLTAFVPLWLQVTRGTPATEAGFALTAVLLGWVVAAVLSTRMLLRTGYRAVVRLGLVGLATATGALATFGPRMSVAIIELILGFVGAGVGLAVPALLIAMQSEVGAEQLGSTTSLNHFFRQMGGAVGVSVVGAMVGGALVASRAPVKGASSFGTSWTAEAHSALSIAMSTALRVDTTFAVAALAVGLMLPNRAPPSEAIPNGAPAAQRPHRSA